LRKKNRQSSRETVSLDTQSRQPGCDITPSLGLLSVEDVYVRGTRVETPPDMLARDVAQLIDRAGIVRGVAKVGAVAPVAAILTLSEGLAVFYIVVVGTAPQAEEGIVTGAVGPGVVEEVAGMVDLTVGQVFNGGHAVDDTGGNAVIGVGVRQGLGALKVLLSDVS
jgi:hypothetical protein